jgi:hypothetical protein
MVSLNGMAAIFLKALVVVNWNCRELLCKGVELVLEFYLNLFKGKN